MFRAAILTVLVGCGGSAPPAPTPTGPAETVIFVVLDTVRADHVHACGYGRPTTPTLDALVAQGATLRCDAHAPADWTLPSHASYFTGQQVLDHGAIIAPWSDVAILPTIPIRPLADDASTLAEQLAADGFLTAGISGNGVVSTSAGLMQGFVHEKSGPPWEVLAPLIPKQVGALLAHQDPKQKLFLFANLFDAHDPYPEVPAGVDWLEPQPAVDFFSGPDAEAIQALAAGTLPEAARPALLAHMENGYDYGVSVVDGALGTLLETLRLGGWLDRRWRLVVTSDHGEGFAEHGRIRHGGFLTEEATRVPVLVYDSAGSPALPESMAAIDVFHLLKEGEVPATSTAAEAVSFPNPKAELDPGVHSAVIWEGPAKYTWVDGAFARYDLSTDPLEASPQPLTDGPAFERLKAMVAKSEVVGAAPADAGALGEALQQLGYVKKDP